MKKISKSMLNRPTQEDEATSLPEMPSANSQQDISAQKITIESAKDAGCTKFTAAGGDNMNDSHIDISSRTTLSKSSTPVSTCNA